jgi:hypothetical protein
VGPRAGLDIMEKIKIYFLPRDSNTDSSVFVTGLDVMEKRKNILPLPGIEPQLFSHLNRTGIRPVIQVSSS